MGNSNMSTHTHHTKCLWIRKWALSTFQSSMKSVEWDEKIANVQHEMPESPPNESDLVGNQRRTLSMRSELIYWTNQHIENETTINFMYYRMYRSNGWMAFQVNTTCIEMNYRLMGMEAEHFFSRVKLNSHKNWSHSHSLVLLLSFFRKPVTYTINDSSFDTKYILPFTITLTTVTIQYDCKLFLSWSHSENTFP